MNPYASSESSPETDSEDYLWWAKDVARNLHNSVVEAVTAVKPTDKEEMAAMTRQIAREVASQIPRSAVVSLVNDLRDKMKIMESSCVTQMYDPEAKKGGSSLTYFNSPTGERLQFGSTLADKEMGQILTKTIPDEVSKHIARDLYRQLMENHVDSDSSDEEHAAVVDPAKWRKASVTFDTYMGEESGNKGRREEQERKFYLTDTIKQRSDAYKKFKMVLLSGNGFRVTKHNHNGGTKMRILKYDASKSRLTWESSKTGGESIYCSRIKKVHREICVVYIWYMAVGRHGSKKKMVGFETQREADARIFELALLYIVDGTKPKKK